MTTSTLVVLVALVIVVVVAVGLIVKTEHSKRLRSRFGPEYHRAVEETGSTTEAESRLQKLERRVEGFKIRPLSAYRLCELPGSLAEDSGPLC